MTGFGLLALVPIVILGMSIQPNGQSLGAVSVMSGLDNPRGMAFGPDGALFVAEAGRGPANHSCFDDSTQADCTCPTCFVDPTPDEIQQHTCLTRAGGQRVCSGGTGAISRLWRGVQERVVTGLPSIANAAGRAEGPNSVSMLGLGNSYISVGLEAAPDQMERLRDGLGSAFGRVVRVVLPSGNGRFVADLVAYENTFNPEPRIFDSNPFGVLAVPGGALVVDAGGNDLLRFDNNTGGLSTLAILRNDPSVSVDGDQVPTAITTGPDGTLYLGQLTGAPFPDGAAKVYRFLPGSLPDQALVPVCTGFKAIISLAFDGAGNLYVLQHSSGSMALMGDGAIYRIAASAVDGSLDCTRDTNATRIAADIRLVRPTSILVGADGFLYVTNDGLMPGQGEVLRVVP